MNIPHRLRTCAKHTGLDAVIELLQEAADEIDATQARAQVQGEPFGYIHHFAAHDESGALIDTTWEADGCADPLPHPTSPSMWKWAHCTPFYTTPQPVHATQAEAQQPATPEPVGFTYQAEIDYANSTGGNGSFWRVPPDLDDEAVPLYTHPAPSVPDPIDPPAEDGTEYDYCSGRAAGYAEGWNACRAAMLAAK